MKTPATPHPLLDAVMAAHRLRSDAHLADELAFSRARISMIRNRHAVASAEFKLALMRRFGMSLKEIDRLDSAAPPAQKEKAHD